MSAPQLQLVVFDLDGTLVDSSRDLADGVNAMLARMAPGTTPIPLDAVRRYIGSGAGKLVERSLRHVGLDRPVAEVLPVFLEEYRARLLVHTRLYDGAREVLDALRPATLAVLTNKPGGMSREILAGLGVGDRFAAVYGPDDVPARKPDPAGLLKVMADTGAQAAGTVMVGDSAIDVETARAGGVVAVGLRQGFDPEGLEGSGADVEIDDLRELPAALAGRFSRVLP